MTIERARELIAEHGIKYDEYWAGGKLYTTLSHSASPDEYDCLTDEEIIDSTCQIVIFIYGPLPPLDVVQYLCRKTLTD